MERRNISSVTSFHRHGTLHFVFPMQDMFSATSLSLVVQYLLKSAGMNYTAYQHTLFFTILLLSRPLFAFNFDCLNRILSYINSVLR